MNEDAGNLDIRSYLQVVKRWLGLIIVAAVLAGAAALALSRSAAHVYEATASLMVGQGQTTNAPDYNTILLDERLAKTYAQLLKARPVLREVAQRLGMPTDDRSLDKMSEAITVEAIKDTELIRVTARDADPTRAANLANLLLQVFTEQSLASQTTSMTASLRSLSAEMNSLQTEIDSAQKTLEREQARPTPNAATVARLDSQLKQLRGAMDSLQQSYEQTRTARVREVTLLRISETAEPPMQPVAPRTLLNVLLATIAGVVLATGGAFFIEALDDTVKRPEDVERATGLPTLATIGRTPRRPDSTVPFVAQAPHTRSAEGYRRLRTNIELSATGEGQAPSAFVVTGVHPAMGVTTIVANLGASLAQSGKDVLLIDGNLGRPNLNRHFGLPTDAGLTSLLHGNAGFDGTIQQTSVPHLRLLAAGPPNSSPNESLNLGQTKALLKALRNTANYILVDAPAVLGAADACILARGVDGVILVARAGKTTNGDLRRAAQALERASTPVLGVVLNAGA